MLTDTSKWSHARGNEVVPYRWQATRAVFWWWLLTWRRRARPTVFHSVAVHAPRTTVYVVRTPRELRAVLLTVRTAPPPRDAGAIS